MPPPPHAKHTQSSTPRRAFSLFLPEVVCSRRTVHPQSHPIELHLSLKRASQSYIPAFRHSTRRTSPHTSKPSVSQNACTFVTAHDCNQHQQRDLLNVVNALRVVARYHVSPCCAALLRSKRSLNIVFSEVLALYEGAKAVWKCAVREGKLDMGRGRVYGCDRHSRRSRVLLWSRLPVLL